MNRPHFCSPFFFCSFLSFAALGLAGCSSDSGSGDTGDGDGDVSGDGDGDGDVPGDGDGDILGDGDGDIPGDGDGISGTACDRTERIGSFVLTLAEDYTTFRGAVSNGISPNAVPEVVASSGSCELLGAPNLFCATPCESGMVCAGDDQCIPQAEKVSAGLVTVSGLNAEISKEANGITSDYNQTFDDPYPGFDVNAAITLTAAGDEATAFTLSGEGVGLLTSSVASVDLVEGSDLALTWDTSGASDSSSIKVELTVNAHGGTAAWIQCSTDDTGSFSIPADLIQQLVDLGLSGFPRVALTRQTLDSTDLGTGCVDFAVSSDVTLEVAVDGLVSCNSDDDCPDGLACNPSLYCE